MEKEREENVQMLDSEQEFIIESSSKSLVQIEAEVNTENFEITEESDLNTCNSGADPIAKSKVNCSNMCSEKMPSKPPDKYFVKKEESTRYRPLHLPLARIKQIIKMDPDVHLAGSEAVFLIAKSAELFIELLSKDAYAFTVSSKKKTIQKKDVDSAIANTDTLIFLDGALDF